MTADKSENNIFCMRYRFLFFYFQNKQGIGGEKVLSSDFI